MGQSFTRMFVLNGNVSDAYYIMLPQAFPQQKQCFIFIEKKVSRTVCHKFVKSHLKLSQ